MTVAKIIEISAESPKGFEDAVNNGLERARRSLDGVRSAWIQDQQISVLDDGKLSYRVNMRVTFVVKGELQPR